MSRDAEERRAWTILAAAFLGCIGIVLALVDDWLGSDVPIEIWLLGFPALGVIGAGIWEWRATRSPLASILMTIGAAITTALVMFVLAFVLLMTVIDLFGPID
jgi:hypothetical protein